MWEKSRLRMICLALLLSIRPSQMSSVVCCTRLDSGEYTDVVIRYGGRPVALLESVQLAVFVLEKAVVLTFQRRACRCCSVVFCTSCATPLAIGTFRRGRRRDRVGMRRYRELGSVTVVAAAAARGRRARCRLGICAV